MYSGVKDIQIQSGTANATFALNVGSVSPELDLTAGGGINTADVEGGYLNNLNLTNFQVLNVSGGTLDLGKDLSVNDFTESGGIFTGQGNLTVTQGAVWSAGEMDGNGVTIIGSGADFSISGSTTKNLGGRTIKNWGSMTWSGATLTGNTGAIQNWLYGNLTAEGVFDGFFLNEGELTPGTGSVAGTITVNGDYEETYDSTLNLMPGDEITASGQIVLDGNLLLGSGFGSTSAGTVDTLIDNTGSQAITGTFSGLAQGAIFYVAGPSSGGTWYQISYQGGSGNSVTITALGARRRPSRATRATTSTTIAKPQLESPATTPKETASWPTKLEPIVLRSSLEPTLGPAFKILAATATSITNPSATTSIPIHSHSTPAMGLSPPTRSPWGSMSWTPRRWPTTTPTPWRLKARWTSAASAY